MKEEWKKYMNSIQYVPNTIITINILSNMYSEVPWWTLWNVFKVSTYLLSLVANNKQAI